jgi:hypothetical protein
VFRLPEKKPINDGPEDAVWSGRSESPTARADRLIAVAAQDRVHQLIKSDRNFK